ncbi:MAG: extracellular solute-binding protein [Clostridia bacterium]|nr:extracellular solute-binding protein [Clostridia bacterium]
MRQTGKLKRFFLHTVSALLALSTVFSLAACGGASDDSADKGGNTSVGGNETSEGGSDSSDITYDGSKQTIKFYHSMGQRLEPGFNAAVKRFNALYPNITIDADKQGGYDDVLKNISTELMANTHPSLAYCYQDHVAYYNNYGAVATLDDLIANDSVITRADGSKEILGLTDEQISKFIPSYYEEGRVFGDGLMYTLPLYKSTELFYYNKDFFTQHNLTPPTTWDELEVLCAKIKEIDPSCIPLGYDSEANWFITMCEQLESPYTTAIGEDPEDFFLFNNETNHEFVAKFAEWYNKGYITTQDLYGGYTSGLFTAQTGQKSYMTIGSSAGATSQRPTALNGVYPFEVGIAPIPQVNPEKPKVISQGPSLCIFNNKKNPQETIAAWLFAKFLATDVAYQVDIALNTGYVPVTTAVESNPTYQAEIEYADGKDNIAQLAIKTCMAQSNNYFVSPAFNGSAEARKQVGVLMQYCFTNGVKNGVANMSTIRATFDAAIEECIYSIE